MYYLKTDHRSDLYLSLIHIFLSPAAREYLQQNKVKIVSSKDKPLRKSNIEVVATDVPPAQEPEVPKKVENLPKPKYVDDTTGAFYFEKPEHMTQLAGNRLVAKDDKRILFRGKLDALEALFVLNQTILIEMGEDMSIVEDLEDVLTSIREMMRCDVLEEPFTRETIIGLTHAELREHSHYPMKYYKVKQMVLPSYKLGKTYALLNQMRTDVYKRQPVQVRTTCISRLDRVLSFLPKHTTDGTR